MDGSRPVQTSAEPKASIAQQFVGTWRQVSSAQRLADGTTRSNPMYGPGGIGYLIYTDANRVCVVVMDPSRPKWKNEASPTDSEVRSAINGLMAYCGTYEVNAEEGFVIHHIEADQVPNRVGSSQKRYYRFEGNRLILRPAPPLPAGILDYTITWERVEK